MLRIVAKPALLLLLPVFKFVYDWYSERQLQAKADRAREIANQDSTLELLEQEKDAKKAEELLAEYHQHHQPALQDFWQNIMRVIFLCYPSVCNMAFSTLHCRPGKPNGYTVLVDDDRVECGDGQHTKYVVLSVGVILIVGLGIPLALYVQTSRLAAKCCTGCCGSVPVNLEEGIEPQVFDQASKELSEIYEKGTKKMKWVIPTGVAARDMVIAAYIETTRLQPYKSFTEAYVPYRPGMRRILCIPWSNSTWESVDVSFPPLPR